MLAVMFEDRDAAECLPDLLPYYPQVLRNTLLNVFHAQCQFSPKLGQLQMITCAFQMEFPPENVQRNPVNSLENSFARILKVCQRRPQRLRSFAKEDLWTIQSKPAQALNSPQRDVQSRCEPVLVSYDYDHEVVGLGSAFFVMFPDICIRPRRKCVQYWLNTPATNLTSAVHFVC